MFESGSIVCGSEKKCKIIKIKVNQNAHLKDVRTSIVWAISWMDTGSPTGLSIHTY